MAGECLREFLKSGACVVAPPASDPKVLALQKGLKFAGYDPGKIDGVMGDDTRKAIKKLQQVWKVPVTGAMDAQTQAVFAKAIAVVQMGNAELVRAKAITDKAKADIAKAQAEAAKKPPISAKAEGHGLGAGVTASGTASASSGALDALGGAFDTVSDVISTPSKLVVGGMSKAHDKLDEGIDAVADAVLPEKAANTVKGVHKVVVGARHTSEKMLTGAADPRSQKQTLDEMAQAYVKGKEEGGTLNGVKDAINTVNPVYHGAVEAVETYRAFERGDYEAMGEHGTQFINNVMAVVGIAEGVGAVGSGVRGGGVRGAGAGGEVVGEKLGAEPSKAPIDKPHPTDNITPPDPRGMPNKPIDKTHPTDNMTPPDPRGMPAQPAQKPVTTNRIAANDPQHVPTQPVEKPGTTKMSKPKDPWGNARSDAPAQGSETASKPPDNQGSTSEGSGNKTEHGGTKKETKSPEAAYLDEEQALDKRWAEFQKRKATQLEKLKKKRAYFEEKYDSPTNPYVEEIEAEELKLAEEEAALSAEMKEHRARRPARPSETGVFR